MLVVGYIVFWIELFFFDTSSGSTSWLAWISFFLLSAIICIRSRDSFFQSFRYLSKTFKERSRFEKIVIVCGCFLSLIILLITLKASFLPPHFPQEYDTINYHITIPRQHLIANSFSHLSWSTADLYFLPIDFSLSPYWLATELPNKIPQIFFAIGLIGILANLIKIFSKNNEASIFFIIFAILGSHNISIQLGTAMLDIVICYLFFAAVHSFLKKNYMLCSMELAFYFWSKSFFPIMIMLVITGILILIFLLKKIGFKIKPLFFNEPEKNTGYFFHRVFIVFLAMSMVVGVPFIAKSIKYTGSPLFPFFVGKINLNKQIDVDSQHWLSIKEKAGQCLKTKDQYGSGRSPIEFLKHLWLIAVPEKGVNNRYDYPIGLTYLLCLWPFLYLFFESIKRKQINILLWFITIYWVLWWFGSQQTRFLYVPIIAMFIAVISQKRFLTNIFCVGILISLLLVSISVFRAHKNDFGKNRYEVLRSKDKELLEMSKYVDRTRPVSLNFEDAAFADFLIKATNHHNSVFVLKFGTDTF